MSPSGSPPPWRDFTVDPRTPQAAPLRASDRDRDVVSGVLGEAYADGRLTREEYDERAGVAATAKTLGELPALILDLVPQTAEVAGPPDRAIAGSEALRVNAVQHWESQRRQALAAFLLPTVICWTIWLLASFRHNADPGFPWPLFVMLGTAAHLVRVLMSRQDIIADEQRRLEKRQRKALEARRHPRSHRRFDAG